MKKSAVYKFKGKLFRYNFDECLVEYIAKATKEELEENKEWQKKFGKNLWDIDENGYIEIDAVGLRKENWTRKEVRDEYLSEWAAEMHEALEYELAFEMRLCKEVK